MHLVLTIHDLLLTSIIELDDKNSISVAYPFPYFSCAVGLPTHAFAAMQVVLNNPPHVNTGLEFVTVELWPPPSH
jgi:hypothetical protein